MVQATEDVYKIGAIETVLSKYTVGSGSFVWTDIDINRQNSTISQCHRFTQKATDVKQAGRKAGIKSTLTSRRRCLIKHESPHVRELLLVDVSVLVVVERLDELTRACLVEPGHLHYRPSQLVDRQEAVSTRVEAVKELHHLLLTASRPTSQKKNIGVDNEVRCVGFILFAALWASQN